MVAPVLAVVTLLVVEAPYCEGVWVGRLCEEVTNSAESLTAETSVRCAASDCAERDMLNITKR